MSSLPSILVAFAHPDDEAFPTGGIIAHYAKLGHRVVLVCATKGEAGQIKAPELSHVTDLGAVRVEELSAACKALGIEPPIFLGYHDSGRNERLRVNDSNALHNANLWEVEAKIREVIAEVRPKVVITFDPHGGYGHPDHLVMHRAATAAFYSSGYLPEPPQRLFYSAFTIERATQMQQSGQADSIFGGLDPKVYGVSEETIALRMDVQAYVPQKMAAALAHRSQFAQRTDQINENPERRAFFERMMAVETFALGGTRGPIPHWPLNDLLDGLEFRD
jgi:LmbE family N-acetylglucosaminyl deacetylase